MTDAAEPGGTDPLGSVPSPDADVGEAKAPRWRRVARRLNLREIVRHNGLVLLALWGLAVAQPVLDLFGKNPEFFVANSLSKYEVAAFGVVMALGVPLVLIAVEVVAYAIHRSLGVAVHVALVFGLGAFFGLYLARQLGVSNDVLSIGAALAAGGLILYGERRVAGVRLGLHYLAFAPVVFLASFLLFSSTSKLLTEEEAVAATGVTIGEPAPIVILQMDELPVASLMTEDGTINAERFPNFARLADEGTWYRNATSVSPKTTDSIPAMLSGLIPELGALPTSADHPRTLFTLLGDQYEQHVTEPVTSVCPDTVCVNRAGQEKFQYQRSRQALLDASVVYFQATLPPFLREGLPAVDRAWGGFIEDANVEAEDPNAALDPSGGADQSGSAPSTDPSYKWKALGPQGWAPRYQAGLMSEMIDGIVPGERPGLHFAHATFPHIPWLLSPEGYQYVVSDARFVPGLENGGIWTDDNDYLVRQGFARHLLQVGYMDSIVGDMIEQLESQGLWEDALVVVLSDHGVAFTPGENFRSPRAATVHEIYNIPLFIKYPGQTEGEISDVNALNLDVLPTIVEALDIDTDWEFDGQSLLGDGPDRDSKPTYWDVGPDEVPVDFDGVMEVVERDHEYLPNGDDWLGVFGQGEYADLVGEDVEDLDVRGGSGRTWTNDQQERLADWQPDADGLAPMLLASSLEADGGAVPDGGVVVVNGRVAGVAGDFHEGDDGRIAFNALISEEILQRGANDVVLLLPTRSGSRQFETATLS
ncbi:MAG: sulfatase-like hydrolase/transferase [Acidimicrobiales bacterium]|nr:sulfatase-like hydrolase/transferase [Acidimicrobiales bacterium]